MCNDSSRRCILQINREEYGTIPEYAEHIEIGIAGVLEDIRVDVYKLFFHQYIPKIIALKIILTRGNPAAFRAVFFVGTYALPMHSMAALRVGFSQCAEHLALKLVELCFWLVGDKIGGR